MVHCPWCELYIKWYLKNSDTFSNKENKREKTRINAGFWATIKQVNDEQFLANKALTVRQH
jgi:hypothetical protein